MTDDVLQLLLIEDNPADAEFIRIALAWTQHHRVDLAWASSLTAGLEKLRESHFDAVLLDLSLPETQGLETLREVAAAHGSVPMIVLTGIGDDEQAVRAVRLGAQDYLVKGEVQGPLILRAVRYAIERKRMQDRIQHARQLESLGALAGGIAHDFNNLLQSIVAYTTVVLDQLDVNHAAAEDLEHIRNLAFRGAELSDQMLTVAGGATLSVKPLQLSDLVRTLRPSFEEVASYHASLRLELAGELVEILGDETQIGQAAGHLVANAAEAIPRTGGEIVVATGTEHYGAERLQRVRTNHALRPGVFVWLEVRDTGRGIRSDPVERVFEPFVSTKASGRGLGLSAVDGIVRGHHGGIELSTQPGRGTVFRLMFPAHGSEARPSARPAGTPGPRDAKTVLVVDDEADIRKWMSFLLERRGYEVLLASDGLEAVEVFDERRDDLLAVILDQTMPRMTGAQAFRRMRELNPDVPVFLISGWHESQAAGALVEEGLAGFLKKPFKPDEIVDQLRRVQAG